MVKPCAGVGNGYWYCDVVGGCRDCRSLARDAEDFRILKDWSEARKAAKEAAKSAL